MIVQPETGDICLLRFVLDARARADLDATLGEGAAFGPVVRALANVLRAHRDAWLSAGAVDAESGRLFEVPDRLRLLVDAERDTLRALDDRARGLDDGPFRGGTLGDDSAVLVVIAIGIRESPQLRQVGRTTLVTIGAIARGHTLVSALDAIAELADGDILGGEILVRPERGRELALHELSRAYSRDELVAVKV
ncbi:MAG: hypothetical protein ACM31C_34915 [Acidobacteriota bacterium]